jgi:prepilin-type N-terminal cleavage/methylation domain-containing protein
MSCLKIKGPSLAARRRHDRGFTLVEVMIAMAIIGIVAVVLLEQRIEVVRDAARARDMRSAWVLTSQKLAELELDKTLWTGQQTQSNGDFGDVDAEFAAYRWDYQIVREPIEIADPKDPEADKKPRELLKLTLVVRTPGVEEPIVVEAEFPIKENKPDAPEPGTTENAPASGTQPPSGTSPAPPGKPR